MSSDTSIYSYNKYNILVGIIYGIIIFCLFFIGSYLTYNFFTLNMVFKKAKYYIDLFKDPKKTNKEKDTIITEKNNNGFSYVLQMIGHLNYALLGDLTDKLLQMMVPNQNKSNPNESKQSELKTYNQYINKLQIKFLPKLYIILLAAGSILMLLKLTVNFTFISIISKTINSSNNVSPFGQSTFKPTTNYYSELVQMILLFLLNVFIAISPTIFIYIFNLFEKLYKNIQGILLMIITLIIFGLVIIYFYYNLFSNNSDLTSNETSSKTILKSFFNKQDDDFADNIFSFKDTFNGSFGVWIFVYIVFFIFEYKYINNMHVNMHQKIIKFMIISLVLFAYSLFIAYRNYGKNDKENNVFDDKYNLQEPMFKDSVNNIFQAIVKYNYPCMPFTSVVVT